MPEKLSTQATRGESAAGFCVLYTLQETFGRLAELPMNERAVGMITSMSAATFSIQDVALRLMHPRSP